MRLHSLEKFGFTGLAVSWVVLFFSDNWIAGSIIIVAAAIPLFVGQHIRHKQELDDLRRRFP